MGTLKILAQFWSSQKLTENREIPYSSEHCFNELRTDVTEYFHVFLDLSCPNSKGRVNDLFVESVGPKKMITSLILLFPTQDSIVAYWYRIVPSQVYPKRDINLCLLRTI